jgi:hypothetical protein
MRLESTPMTLPSSTLDAAATQTASPTPSAAPPSPPWRAWLREPLLHFVVIGALLFGIDGAIHGRSDDPRTIVIGAEVDAEINQLWMSSSGRAPNADEMRALRQRWLDNEILYREGLALRVDRGDSTIRDRVIFKALSVIEANLKRPPIETAELRRWFETQRAKYDEPVRFDFQEAVLVGENTPAAMQAFVQSLNRDSGGEAPANLRVFKGRPQLNLVQSYGDDFARTIAQMPVGEWRALPTRDGLRAIQLSAITPARAAEFEPLRGVVMHDWVDAKLAEQRSEAVRVLGKKYDIRFEGTAP